MKVDKEDKEGIAKKGELHVYTSIYGKLDVLYPFFHCLSVHQSCPPV